MNPKTGKMILKKLLPLTLLPATYYIYAKNEHHIKKLLPFTFTVHSIIGNYISRKYLFHDHMVAMLILSSQSEKTWLRNTSLSIINEIPDLDMTTSLLIAQNIPQDAFYSLINMNGAGSKKIIEKMNLVFCNRNKKLLNLSLNEIEERIHDWVLKLPKINLGIRGNFLKNVCLSDDYYEKMTQNERLIISNQDFIDFDLFNFSSIDQKNRLFIYLNILYSYSKNPNMAVHLLESDLPVLLCSISTKMKNSHVHDELIMHIFLNASSFEPSHRSFKHIAPFILQHFSQYDNFIKYYVKTFLSNLVSSSSGHLKYYPGVYLAQSPSDNNSLPPDFDIVLIHGISGHAFRTWRVSDGKSTKSTVYWPVDWIKNDFEKARILAVGYISEFTKWRNWCPQEKFDVDDFTNELLVSLDSAGIGKRPIVWITHSVGGLVVKGILSRDTPTSQKLLENTKCIIFFAVPHRGCPHATSLKFLLPAVKTHQISPNSEWLSELNKRFNSVIEKREIKILSLGENLPISLYVTNQVILPEPYSDPGYGEYITLPETSHITICKLRSPQDSTYTKIINTIKDSFNPPT